MPPTDAPPKAEPRKFKFIGCEIIYREACYLAAVSPHRVDVELLRDRHQQDAAWLAAEIRGGR